MKKLFSIFTLSLISIISAQAQLPQLRLEEFADGLDQPLDVTNAGDSRLFIVEKAGRIIIIDNSGAQFATPFLDISSEILSSGEEQGLLGLTFDPDYATNGHFFVNYTDLNGDTHISRFSVSSGDPNVADPTSEVLLIFVSQPFANHNGGCLKFGPDGYLYFGLGDGGYAGDPFTNAQNPGTLLGKMSRIDVHGGTPYSIPATNPFVGVPGYREEIWATGLRNPFRFSFDALTGNLWIGDVGQDRFEEVDMQKSTSDGGENYGWDCFEGRRFFQPQNCDQSDPALTFPVAWYPHDGSDCTVIGGFVYRGSMFPKMFGRYIYCDYCSGRFKTLQISSQGTKQVVLFTGEPFEYVSFGEDVNKELYVADLAGGEIYHVVDSSALRLSTTWSSNINVALYPNPNAGVFNVEWNAANDQPCEINIYNSLGQIMFHETRTAVKGFNQWTLNESNYSKGSYLLQIKSADGLVKKEFQVE